LEVGDDFMILEYIRYNIENEHRGKFEEAYKRAAESLTTTPHCLKYELYHCVEEPDNYILRIEWDSQEGHLKGFRESQEFQTFLETVRPFFNNIEEMHHYELTDIKGEK
jgi:quinol monooxygenase YgiN